MKASRKSKVISLSIAQGVLMVSNIALGMVFSRTLSVTDYGTYLQTFLAYNFAVPILTLGLPSALFYFLPGEVKRQKGLVLDNLLLLFISALIFSFFLHFGGSELLAKRFNNPALVKTLKWMVFYPLYTFPLLIAGTVWVVKDKVKLNAVYNVITGLVLTISLILAAIISKSYEAPTLLKIFIPLIFVPFAFYFLFKNVQGSWDLPRVSSMKKMIKFAIPLGLASVFGSLAIQLAGVVVSFLATPEDFAIYANGAKEVPFISIITGSISVVIMAEMSHKIKQNKINEALELFRKATAISASFLMPIMILLLIFAESFINILYSNKYEQSVLPFRMYLFIIPVRIAYYGAVFIAFGKTKLILVRSIVDLCLTAVFCYLFVIWLGPYGAALGLIFALVLWSVPYNLVSLGKFFKCSITYTLPFKTIAIIIVLSLISGLISFPILLFNLSDVLEFCLGAIAFMFVYSLLSFKYIDVFRETMKGYLNKILKNGKFYNKA